MAEHKHKILKILNQIIFLINNNKINNIIIMKDIKSNNNLLSIFLIYINLILNF